MDKFVAVDETEINQDLEMKNFEGQKRIIAKVVGKKYEPQVCSILDYARFLYYTPEQADALDKELFGLDFVMSDLFKEIHNMINDDLFEMCLVDRIQDVKFNQSKGNGLSSSFKIDFEPIRDFIILPIDASPVIRFHEQLHSASSKCIWTDDPEVPDHYAVKSGLIMGEDNMPTLPNLNEIFTQYLANRAVEELKKQGGQVKDEGPIYSDAYALFFKDLFDENFDVFLDAYMGDSIEPIVKLCGAENLTKIERALTKQVNNLSAPEDGQQIGEAIDCFLKSKGEIRIERKQDYFDRLDEFEQMRNEFYEFFDGFEQIENAVEQIKEKIATQIK